jgi:hypothetical protein
MGFGIVCFRLDGTAFMACPNRPRRSSTRLGIVARAHASSRRREHVARWRVPHARAHSTVVCIRRRCTSPECTVIYPRQIENDAQMKRTEHNQSGKENANVWLQREEKREDEESGGNGRAKKKWRGVVRGKGKRRRTCSESGIARKEALSKKNHIVLFYKKNKQTNKQTDEHTIKCHHYSGRAEMMGTGRGGRAERPLPTGEVGAVEAGTEE